MANAQDFTAFFKDAPFAVDATQVTDAWKSAASFGERFTAIAVDAVGKSNSITTDTVKETLVQLRTVIKVQDAPEGCATAVSDFTTAQSELLKSHSAALGEVAKQTQTDATELLSAAAQDIADKGNKAANDAGTKAKAAVNTAEKAA